MALRLLEHPLSPYARKVKIVLYEKGIPFERVFVNPTMTGDDPAVQEFLAASPRLEVPCLVHGRTRIFDSTIILEYLEDRWPQPPSQPTGAVERARVRMLEEICDTEIEAVNWGLMELRFFGRAEGEKAERMVSRAGQQLERLFGRLERELEGRRWMNGERFGRGDAAVHPHVAGAAGFGFPIPERFQKLRDWAERTAARQSIRRDAEEVGIWLKENLGSDSAGFPTPVVRQYRDYRLEWMMKTGGVDIVLAGLANGTIRFATEHR